MSFNTLTPHYEEDVIYALAAADTAKQLGLAGPDAHKASMHVCQRCDAVIELCPAMIRS